MAIDSVTLQGFLPELGIFTLLSFLLTLMYLETVKGKIHRIPGQLSSYQWVIMQSEGNRKKLANCLTGFVILFLFIPIITLIIWGSIVSYSVDDTRSNLDTNPKPLITPIAIFLVGFAAMSFLIGVLNTKWKKYRLTKCSLTMTALGLLLLVGFQIIAIFLDEPVSFFGVSTIFLAGNALFVILVVFINSDTGGRSAQDIIQKLPVSEPTKPDDNQLEEVKEMEVEQNPSGQSQHSQPSHHLNEEFKKKRKSTRKALNFMARMKDSFHGPAVVDQPIRDRYRDLPFDEEIAHDQEDPAYMVTKQQVAELFTLADVQLKGGMAGAFGGGVQKLFSKMTRKKLCCISFILYAIAIGILVGYAFTVNEYTPEGRLGWLNGISLIIVDILIGLYFHSGIVNAPSQIALMVVIFRALTFVFGGRYWYLGYSLLFLIFGAVIALAIARKHYPFSEDFEEAFKARRLGRKKIGTQRVDLSRSPEFLYVIQILLFAGLTVIVEWVQPKGVPRPRFEIVSGADFAYYWFGIFSVLLSALALTIFCMLRILYRQKIKLYPTKNVFLFWSWFSPYWIYALVFYVFALIGGYILWLLLDNDWTVFTLCAFIPPLILLALNAYTNYVGNDYRVLQDVGEENRLRMREYKRRQNALRKARNIKEDMMRGTMTKFGESKSTQPMDPLAMTMSKFKDSLDMPGGMEEPKSPELNKDSSLEQSGRSPSPQNKEVEMKKVMEMAQDKDLQLVLEVQEYKEIFNWRKQQKASCCKAFWKGQLRPTDYSIIISLILFFAVNIAMGLTLTSIRSNWSGMSLTVALFGYYFSFAPLIKVIATDAKMRCPENTQFAFAYVLVYVYGILFFLFHLDSEPKKERDFIIGYMVVLPFTFSLICGLYKWKDNSWKFGPFVIGMGVLSFIYIFAGVALVWWLYSYISGLVILIVAVLLIYSIISISAYIRNKFYMPKGFYYANLAIAFLIVVLALILSIFLDSFNIFVGFSISFGVLVLIIFALGIDELAGDLWRIEDEPLFFSPWVFPIYQFNSKKDRLIQRNKGALLVYFALFLALAWSVLCVVWIDPMHIGVGVCALCEMLLVIITLYLSSFSPLQLKASWPFIDPKTLKRAWLEAKKEYTTGRNAFSMADLETFADVNRQAYDLASHIRGLFRKPPIRVYEKLPDNAPDGVDINSAHSLMGYLFQLQEEANQVYMEEVELIVHFQLLLIVYSKSVQIRERQKLFKFLGSKSTVLLANGVDIKWKMKTNDSVRFARIMNQVERLPAEKRVLFQKMQEAYEMAELRKAQLDAEREIKEHEAMRQREERRRQRKKLAEIKEVPKDVPLDDLPDSLGKWLRVLEEHNFENRFTDGQFPPNQQSLGENVKDRVREWIRADASYDLYKGNVNHLDIEQGMLGDCYFLSALSVLGDKRVKSTIVTQPGQRVGGYCVIFYDDTGAQDYVIVDDYIPIDEDGRPCFVASRDVGELWPVIIEKAYAKLNGNYMNIEAGKVQYALADLTGGVPEEIKLSTVSNKISSFWKKIQQYHEGGYLMGAGTPEHEMGDRAINDLGIVQGHAYSILDVKEVDGNRLVRLMNPHGSRGVEWEGDWGDNSDKWTQRIKNRIHYEDKEDGAFWMGVNDFVEQFKNIYICRQFDPAKWKSSELKGEWKGPSAAGLPSRSNPKCHISDNPHYGIKVGKPCTLFILVTQSEAIDTFKGKLPIMFLLLKNKGQRIQKLKRELIVGQSGNPTNLKTITAEINLDKSLSYPYTFSLMVASAFSGEKGESEFTLKIFSTSGFQVNPLPE